jgi:hypothetical protein
METGSVIVTCVPLSLILELPIVVLLAALGTVLVVRPESVDPAGFHWPLFTPL